MENVGSKVSGFALASLLAIMPASEEVAKYLPYFQAVAATAQTLGGGFAVAGYFRNQKQS